nr:MAG TPA: hypothetical protein [Caudoviricetes sp.]
MFKNLNKNIKLNVCFCLNAMFKYTHRNKTTKETGDSKCTPTSKTPPSHGLKCKTKPTGHTPTPKKRRKRRIKKKPNGWPRNTACKS